MMPIVYVVVFLVLAVNLILGLPKAVDLVQTQVLASNLPVNQTTRPVLGTTYRGVLPKSKQIVPPTFSATAVLAKDLNSDYIYFAKDSDKRVPMASTTKIMTALVAMQYFQADDILSVPDLTLVTGSKMGLVSFEKITFRNLLYGLLLASGNDAAFALAQNYPGGEDKFLERMNTDIIAQGLLNTHFSNVAGFDQSNHYSSATDLAKIASLAMEEPLFARIVGTREAKVASADQAIVHHLKNLNKLLDQPRVLGIKTGTTPQAKENLVGLVDQNGQRILIVILGSNDRFEETEKLLEWIAVNFSWQ